MRFINIVLILFCVICSSCVEDSGVDDVARMNGSSEEKLDTRSVQDSLSFELLPDPYSLINMQSVYDQYLGDGEVVLFPTHFYVRFLPQNSEQLDVLLNNVNLNLSPTPLDLNPMDEEEYMQNVTSSGDYYWLYDIVDVNFVFPIGVQYEIIRPCYFPEANEIISSTRGEIIAVEAAACSKLGYELHASVNSLSKQYPSGVIGMYDNDLSRSVPVKGVKVECSFFGKRGFAYTNSNGEYEIPVGFCVNPSYKLVFKNERGFSIMSELHLLSPTRSVYGFQSAGGYSKVVQSHDWEWEWCAINNSICEYLDSCAEKAIVAPPSNLRVWALKIVGVSSAPMLRRITSSIDTTWGDNWVENLINTIYGSTLTELIHGLRKFLPDVIIGTKNKTSYEIYRTVHHELSHASHFMQVGDNYWAKYIAYIMSYGSYGNGTGENAELCAIGEMWGYAICQLHAYQKYSPNKITNLYIPYHDSFWFKPDILWNLIVKYGLSEKNVFDCLTEDVDTYAEFIERLADQNPANSEDIYKTFVYYGVETDANRIMSNVVLGPTLYVSDSVIYGCEVETNDFSVDAGADLTILFEYKASLNNYFYVSQDARFELREVF